MEIRTRQGGDGFGKDRGNEETPFFCVIMLQALSYDLRGIKLLECSKPYDLYDYIMTPVLLLRSSHLSLADTINYVSRVGQTTSNNTMFCYLSPAWPGEPLSRK